MSAKTQTIDFSNETFKRSVVETYTQYLTETSSAVGIFLENGRNNFPVCDNTKYEWMESQLTPLQWTVNDATDIAIGASKTITVDSGANGLIVWSILRFSNPTTRLPVGTVQVKVTAVNSDTEFVGTVYGSNPDIVIPDDSVIHLVSKPKAENNKDFVAQNNLQPTFEYNYTQNFEVSVELSDTAINSASYGNTTQLATQMQQGMYLFTQEVSEQLFYGQRVKRASGENGSFGGIPSFVDVSGGNVVDASGSAISTTLINDLGEEIKRDGGVYNAIYTNLDQARKISAFNTSGSNPITQVSRDEVSAGSYVLNFVSDIPVAGGLISRIIVDEKVPADTVYLLNSDKIGLVPYANRDIRIVDGTQNGQDGQTALLRAELTLALADGKYSHGVLKNLAL